MKRFLFIVVAIMSCAGVVMAQGGQVSVFADAGGVACNIIDSGGLVQVHIMHVHHFGVTASSFKLDIGSLPWTHLGDIWNFPTVIGSSLGGAAVGYGSCLTLPVHIVAVNFFGSTAPACTQIGIIGNPDSTTGLIEAVDCSAVKWTAYGGHATVNATPACYCDLPVEETTWGGIKALYQ